jgi:hypothetical protein
MVDLIVLTRSDQLLFLLPEVNSTEPPPSVRGSFAASTYFPVVFPACHLVPHLQLGLYG